jgi:hypothetical protein
MREKISHAAAGRRDSCRIRIYVAGSHNYNEIRREYTANPAAKYPREKPDIPAHPLMVSLYIYCWQ